MHDQASPPAPAAPADREVLVPGALEAVIRALAEALTSAHVQSTPPVDPGGDRPLLDLEKTAELLGVSRMTVARMADEGRLPSVVVRRGRVQKTHRIPRAFVDRMVADACAGAQVDMEEYAAAWLAEHAVTRPAGEADFHRAEQERG
jgi:excisionase family DNA binding protein